jgi:hypothetical protein
LRKLANLGYLDRVKAGKCSRLVARLDRHDSPFAVPRRTDSMATPDPMATSAAGVEGRLSFAFQRRDDARDCRRRERQVVDRGPWRCGSLPRGRTPSGIVAPPLPWSVGFVAIGPGIGRNRISLAGGHRAMTCRNPRRNAHQKADVRFLAHFCRRPQARPSPPIPEAAERGSSPVRVGGIRGGLRVTGLSDRFSGIHAGGRHGVSR